MTTIEMNNVKSELCCGCLCTDRKISLVTEFEKKHCFLQIINEIQVIPPESVSLWLCWECEAHILHFTKFKQQVKFAYKILHKLDKQNENLPHIEKSAKLGIHRVIDINLDPNVTEYEPYKVIKLEKENFDINIADDDIKVESDHASLGSDEDTLLIEYKKKKKDLNGPKKERRKRKKDIEMEIYKEIELSREEILEERRLQELREEYVNAMFKCENCIMSFPNVDDLKDHADVKHNLNSSHSKCDICSCSFSSEVSYNYHTNRHKRRYQCRRCSERFTSKRSATKHYELFHTHQTHMNYATDKMSQSNGNLDNTSTDPSSHQETPSFPCEFCDKTFKWKTSLRKHVETHRIETGQKRKPYCEPCRLSFTTTSNLQKHVKTSSKHQIQLKLRKLVTESVLEDTSTPEKQEARISQIKYSVMTSHQQFPCPQCDKKFQWRGNLLRHLHSHTARANGELVCAPCNRTFSSIATYKQHMAISKKHVTENDFKYMCIDCGKRFANKTRLKDHVDWEHLKNYVHTCAVCQKVFKSHTSLYLHKQVVHKKDGAEHLCDHCGKAFPNHAKLRSHITAFHTRQSPYKCAQCAARFNWHSCLSRHVRRVHRRCKEP